jgi:hypothetical protein
MKFTPGACLLRGPYVRACEFVCVCVCVYKRAPVFWVAPMCVCVCVYTRVCVCVCVCVYELAVITPSSKPSDITRICAVRHYLNPT